MLVLGLWDDEGERWLCLSKLDGSKKAVKMANLSVTGVKQVREVVLNQIMAWQVVQKPIQSWMYEELEMEYAEWKMEWDAENIKN